jgi:serine/threonine protein kinase
MAKQGERAVDGRVSLSSGTRVGGNYRIERVIGAGGFAITYAATDLDLSTVVAIKEYYPSEFGARDEGMRVHPRSARHAETFDWGKASFLEEARMLARFRHPSIVRVSRVFEAHATAYMVMDYEAGKDLATWLRDLGRAPAQSELDRIAAPLLDALEIMHGESFLHRDIAPDNIVVRPDGSPVLLDFGAARRAVGEKSRSLTGIVKTGYSPFEQYATDGRLQGPWTDLYALGATLYRAVCGITPPEATLRVADDRMQPAVDAAVGTYRKGFLAAIDACLRPSHADRPQSVAALRPVLLHDASADRLAPTRKVPAAPPVPASGPRPGKRRWAIVAAAIAVVAGVSGGLTYSHWQDQERRRIEEARKRADMEAGQRRLAAERAEREQVAELRAQEERRRRTEEEARLRADAEARRLEQEKRAAEARAAEERRLQQEADTRARQQREVALREEQRRQTIAAMQRPIDNLFSSWRALDADAYVAQWAPGAMKVDRKAGTTKTIDQLAGERRRFFQQLSRVQADYRVQYRGMNGNAGSFDVAYTMTFHYRNGRSFTESACEDYVIENRDGAWLIVRNEDYKPCS